MMGSLPSHQYCCLLLGISNTYLFLQNESLQLFGQIHSTDQSFLPSNPRIKDLSSSHIPICFNATILFFIYY